MEAGLFSYPTPFTPPTTEEDELSVLRLIRSRRVGATTYHRLLADHGTASAALAALPDIARTAGVADYSVCPEGVALGEMKAARRAGARLLCAGAPGYPPALAQLSDAPPVLWLLGDVRLLTRPMVALVGARNASSLGTRMARRLAEGLGEAGYVVVSGLARGIDAAAHLAALANGTVAAMAGGVDVIYPAENTALAENIAAQGLRLSEQPIGLEPQARHFPMRNRIISGLCQAVVVVEAAARSGSLITARMALDQGREVLAVPGHPLDARAAGCNMLIRDGAVLVRGADDVVAALTRDGPAIPTAAAQEPSAEDRRAGSLRPAAPRAMEPGTATLPATATAADTRRLCLAILDRLGPSPLAEDQLIRDLALPAAIVAQGVLMLEIDGAITRHAGGFLARVV